MQGDTEPCRLRSHGQSPCPPGSPAGPSSLYRTLRVTARRGSPAPAFPAPWRHGLALPQSWLTALCDPRGLWLNLHAGYSFTPVLLAPPWTSARGVDSRAPHTPGLPPPSRHTLCDRTGVSSHWTSEDVLSSHPWGSGPHPGCPGSSFPARSRAQGNLPALTSHLTYLPCP